MLVSHPCQSHEGIYQSEDNPDNDDGHGTFVGLVEDVRAGVPA